MSNISLDADRFVAEHSEQEVTEFVGQVMGRIWGRDQAHRATLPIKDPTDQDVLGYIAPLMEESTEPEMLEFLASFNERLKNPPKHFLSYEDLVSQVREECARARPSSPPPQSNLPNTDDNGSAK